MYNEIIEKVLIEGDTKEDIIAFYNVQFIAAMKGYMLELKEKPVPKYNRYYLVALRA